MLGAAAAQARGIDLAAHSVRVPRRPPGARKSGDIGFATLRGGSVIGDHSVIFAGDGETIEISHKGERPARCSPAAPSAPRCGARDKKPGLYSMADRAGL